MKYIMVILGLLLLLVSSVYASDDYYMVDWNDIPLITGVEPHEIELILFDDSNEIKILPEDIITKDTGNSLDDLGIIVIDDATDHEPIVLHLPEEQQELSDINWVLINPDSFDPENGIYPISDYPNEGLCLELDLTHVWCPFTPLPSVTCGEWGECRDGIQKRECNISHYALLDGPSFIKTETQSCEMQDNNKGHGNDADGCDNDNPGKGCENGKKTGINKRLVSEPAEESPGVEPMPGDAECMYDSDCIVGGCSGQLCYPKSEGMLFSTCEWQPEYSQYTYSDCGCVNYKCGWGQIEELQTYSLIDTGQDSLVLVIEDEPAGMILETEPAIEEPLNIVLVQ